MSVSFRMTDGEAKPLKGGKMVGVASVDCKVNRHSQSFSGRLARLSFVVPKTARGRQLKVKLTIKAASYRDTNVTAIDALSGDMFVVAMYYSGQSAVFPVR